MRNVLQYLSDNKPTHNITKKTKPNETKKQTQTNYKKHPNKNQTQETHHVTTRPISPRGGTCLNPKNILGSQNKQLCVRSFHDVTDHERGISSEQEPVDESEL